MSKQANRLDPGFMELYDNETPGLPAGTYTVAATLSLPNTDTHGYSQTVSQDFKVEGPQFTLDPSEIHARFPADDTNGDFTQVLPSLVFESPVLPWERMVTTDKAIPWMALLVFGAGELTIDADTHSPLLNTTVEEFLALQTGVVKPDIDAGTVLPGILSGSMNSILVSTAVFEAVTPRLVELSTLAHVRELNPMNQVVTGTADDGWFSVLLANRFPLSSDPEDSAGAINYVQLVSLEGLTTYLVDTPQWPAGAEQVQLVSLASWTFTSAQQPGLTFAELAENLVSSAGGDPTQLLLRIPVTDDGSVAAARLKEGYTALSYHTLPGPDSFCWYRGPLSAVPAQPLPSSIPDYLHPRAAMIYDQANAIFDNSYATAWSIGRLAALADPVFVNSLVRMRDNVISTGTRLLERSEMPHLAGITDLAVLASAGLTRKVFSAQMRAGLGVALNAVFRGGGGTPTAVGGRSGGEMPAAGGAADVMLPAALTLLRVRTNNLFPEEQPPAAPGARMIWFIQKPVIRAFLAGRAAEEMDPLAVWLGNLALLHGISYNHLVPDQRMLPVESARFFYVDQGWLQVLLNGAMSVGLHGTREQLAQQVIAPGLLERGLQKAASARRRLLRMTLPDPVPPPLPAAGLLLRSALVSGWPGLSINATASGAAVNIMRMDRLSPTILLVLWDAVPDTVTISQPEQGIIFGVEDGWTVVRRSLDASNLGAQLPPPSFPATGDLTQFMRPAAADIGGLVLNVVPAVAGTGGYLVPAMAAALNVTAITASQFAIEMVKSPEEIAFAPPT